MHIWAQSPWGKERKGRVGGMEGDGESSWLPVAGESHWVLTIENWPQPARTAKASWEQGIVWKSLQMLHGLPLP